jgi:hypothetical protein
MSQMIVFIDHHILKVNHLYFLIAITYNSDNKPIFCGLGYKNQVKQQNFIWNS